MLNLDCEIPVLGGNGKLSEKYGDKKCHILDVFKRNSIQDILKLIFFFFKEK